MAKPPSSRGIGDRLQHWLPRLVLSPSFVLVLFFVYGFILWTTWISFSNSGMLPDYTWAGTRQWSRLWSSWTWGIALHNIWVFGLLYIVICTVLGLLLAILLDQRIRAEGTLRTIYLYPMALSFIVTGTAWQWFLNPGLGLERTMHSLGWESFSFNWLIDARMAIYTVVIAAVWQATGFIMAMFLAGLRGIDGEMIKAAQIDGAPTWKIYGRIIIPQLRPVFLSAIVVLAHLAIKSFDLIVAMTGGGPGNATAVPATFMYSYAFSRNEMGIAAASAVFMLAVIAALIIPYLYSELRESRS